MRTTLCLALLFAVACGGDDDVSLDGGEDSGTDAGLYDGGVDAEEDAGDLDADQDTGDADLDASDADPDADDAGDASVDGATDADPDAGDVMDPDAMTDADPDAGDADPDAMTDTGTPDTGCVDEDGDGTCATDDCDDTDPRIFPGVPERCDGVDQDCDGLIDEELPTRTFYEDIDGDGYGDDTTSVEACARPDDHVLRGGDCDDDSALASPSVPEICDAMDNDCDGLTDEGVPTEEYFLDEDGDGYGSSTSIDACTRPRGYADRDGDCDDSAPLVHPAAAELCDMVDNDCDTRSDESLLAYPWYLDADGDGYGDPSAPSVESCAPQAGRTLRLSDCDDSDASVRPGAVELCDRVDSDCSTGSGVAFDEDNDGDGHALPSAACTGGFPKDDCDDTTSDRTPGRAERCDGRDNDCDEIIDEEPMGSGSVYYEDRDGDGYGDSASAVELCSGAVPAGYVRRDGDCDDDASAVYPGREEVCNGIDDGCSGVVDDVPSFRAPPTDNPVGVCNTQKRCIGGSWQNAYAMIPGYEAVESSCDERDNDCDDETDESLLVERYIDRDGDGYGDDPLFSCTRSVVNVCPSATGFATVLGDVDDGDASVNPGQAETCNGVDTDSDGAIDEGDLCGPGSLCAAGTCTPCSFPPAIMPTAVTGTNVWCPGALTIAVPSTTVILPDAVLAIGAGNRLLFDAGASLVVRGALETYGTASSPVRFDSSLPIPTNNSWSGIRIENTTGGRVNLNRVDVRHASGPLTPTCCSGAASRVADSLFRDNGQVFGNYSSGRMQIVRTRFEANTGVCRAYELFRDCDFIDNTGSRVFGAATVRGGEVRGNAVVMNSGSGNTNMCDVLVVDNDLLVTSSRDGITGQRCTFADNRGPLTGGSRISQSNICRNGGEDVRINNATHRDYRENYWCETDSAAIAGRIHDVNDDPLLGRADYEPFLMSPAPDAPAIP